MLRQFETLGTYCVNGSAGITASRDKLHAHQLLARHKIGMPRTAFAASPKDTSNLIGLVGTAPLIVKLLESTQGKGVVLAETKKAAQSVIDAFRGLKANFLVQDFVKEAAGEDIRCLVVDGRVVASMKRSSAGDDFRSNLHQGGTAAAVRITREERETALRAARVFGLGLAGVDLLRGGGRAQSAGGQQFARLRGGGKRDRQEHRRAPLRRDREEGAPDARPKAQIPLIRVAQADSECVLSSWSRAPGAPNRSAALPSISSVSASSGTRS